MLDPKLNFGKYLVNLLNFNFVFDRFMKVETKLQRWEIEPLTYKNRVHANTIEPNSP